MAQGKLSRTLARLQKTIITYDSYLIRESDIATPIKINRQPPAGIEYRHATPADLDGFLDEDGEPQSQREREEALSRFSRGDVCLIGIYKGQMISYHWTSFRQADLIEGVSLLLGPGWSYGYKRYTVRGFRNKGMSRNQVGLELTHRYRQSIGIQKSLNLVHTRNHLANPYHPDSRGRVIGRIRRIVLLRKWRFNWMPSWIVAYVAAPAVSSSPVEVR